MKKLLALCIIQCSIVNAMNNENSLLELMPPEIKSKIIYSLVDGETKSPSQVVEAIEKMRRLNNKWKLFMHAEIDTARFTHYFIETLHKKNILIINNTKKTLAAILGTLPAIHWLKKKHEQSQDSLGMKYLPLQLHWEVPDKRTGLAMVNIWLNLAGKCTSHLLNLCAYSRVADLYIDFIRNRPIEPNNEYKKRAIRRAMAGGLYVHKLGECGMTPLIVALQNEREDLVPLLLDPEHIELRSVFGHTPLMYAVEQKSVKNVRALLAHGAQVNAVDRFGNSVLHHAIQKAPKNKIALPDVQNTCIVHELLKAGADLEYKDKIGLSAYDHAVTLKRSDLSFFIHTYKMNKKRDQKNE